MSERKACRLVNQPRGTQRYLPTQREDEDALTQAVIAAASRYGRYGYRRITAVLREDGWRVGQRSRGTHLHPSDQSRSPGTPGIWRREGLKEPQKQKPRGRLWLNDGSCVRLRPEHRNHVCGC